MQAPFSRFGVLAKKCPTRRAKKRGLTHIRAQESLNFCENEPSFREGDHRTAAYVSLARTKRLSNHTTGCATRSPYFRRIERRMKGKENDHEKALGEGVDDPGWGL
jgi:hypothetical protein